MTEVAAIISFAVAILELSSNPIDSFNESASQLLIIHLSKSNHMEMEIFSGISSL
jgi:hypothetical protein